MQRRVGKIDRRSHGCHEDERKHNCCDKAQAKADDPIGRALVFISGVASITFRSFSARAQGIAFLGRPTKVARSVISPGPKSPSRAGAGGSRDFLIIPSLPIFGALPCAAMAINGIAISSSDPGAVPGASTQARRQAGFGGGEIGSTGSVKGVLLLGMVPPSSGLIL